MLLRTKYLPPILLCHTLNIENLVQVLCAFKYLSQNISHDVTEVLKMYGK
jgi:hypothetical protein